jgi:hypothetical protein
MTAASGWRAATSRIEPTLLFIIDPFGNVTGGRQRGPDFPMIYRWPAAALGQLGRTAEAKEALEKAISLAPAAFDMYVRRRVPWFRPEDHTHLVEGLRKAGWGG